MVGVFAQNMERFMLSSIVLRGKPRMVDWDFLCPDIQTCHTIVNETQFEHYCMKPWGNQSKRCPYNTKFGNKILPKAWVEIYKEKIRRSGETAKGEVKK